VYAFWFNLEIYGSKCFGFVSGSPAGVLPLEHAVDFCPRASDIVPATTKSGQKMIVFIVSFTGRAIVHYTYNASTNVSQCTRSIRFHSQRFLPDISLFACMATYGLWLLFTCGILLFELCESLSHDHALSKLDNSAGASSKRSPQDLTRAQLCTNVWSDFTSGFTMFRIFNPFQRLVVIKINLMCDIFKVYNIGLS